MEKLPWQRRIQFQIGMIIIATLAITMSVLGYFQYAQARRDVNERLMWTANHIASKLSINLSRSVYALAPEFAFQILAAEMEDRSVYAIYVHEKGSETIREELFAGYVRDADWQIIQPSAHTHLPQGELVLSRDIVYAGDNQETIIGQVDIHLTRTFAQAEIRRTAVMQMISTISVTTVIGICLLVLLQSTTRPIVNLTEASLEIAKGNFEHHIDVSVNNEIGVLAESFIRMGNAIKQQIRTLQTENAERLRAEAELHRSRQQLQAIIDNSPAIIYLKDLQGRYLLINHQYERLFHISKRAIVGRTDYDIFPEDLAEAFQINDQKVITANMPQNLEESVPHEDGLHTYLSIKFPLYDSSGKMYGVCGVSTDITERKNAEDLLKHYNQQLEQDVEQRTQELQIAKEQALNAKELAETANRAKSTFLANMSHELRTPLNAVLGYTQILSRSQNLPPDEKEHLSTIMRSGEHLLALINDVLELSKIDANRIKLQPVNFDLHQMLLDLEAMFRLRAERKGLTLEFMSVSDVPPYIRADQNKLRQILINLLGNAVKYTEEGKIELRIRNEELGMKYEGSKTIPNSQFVILHFSVADTGVGIAPADLENVFDAFVRVDEQQYNTGTGLGLPISRKYVRMMGGDIHVESDVGKGSMFSFKLPIELVDQSTIDNRQSTIPTRVIGVEPGQPHYRLLIVEDNEDSRHLMVHILQPLGFQVRKALNGAEAITFWKTWQPHLIWMDMRMPVLDGYEATKRIRKAEKQKKGVGQLRSWEVEKGTLQSSIANRQSPIIVALTATAFEEDKVKVLEAGCDDFVRKPFQEADIFNMLHKHLGVRFVYEEETQSSIPLTSLRTGFNRQSSIEEVLRPAALAALAAEWLATLEHGAKETNTKLLFEVIEQIRQHDAAVADALARLTNDFEYDKILALIQQTGK